LHIKLMIQARQFRKAHVDTYALAVFRYQREFSIRYREYCTFVSMDDKHTIKVGEPEYRVAGVERGKQVLVTSSKKLAVADHDFTKFSLTPSVSFIITIPDSILGSFYTGRVFVGLKENAFQPSFPICHIAELEGVVLHTVNDDHPLLLLYTDGGPDHQLTYATVQISLISIFLALVLCAVHTPPYHSWKNPAERIMSILNIGLQSVGVMRQKRQSFEEALKQCNNLMSIHGFGEENPTLEEEVLDAVAPMKALLQGIFIRLHLADHRFETFEAATKLAMEELWKNILAVDATINPEDTTKATMREKVVRNFSSSTARFATICSVSSATLLPVFANLLDTRERCSTSSTTFQTLFLMVTSIRISVTYMAKVKQLNDTVFHSASQRKSQVESHSAQVHNQLKMSYSVMSVRNGG